MKMRLLITTLLLSPVIAAAGPAQTLGDIDKLIGRLAALANEHADDRQLEPLFRAAVKSLQQYGATHRSSWELEWRLGECHQLAGTFEEAEAHLKKAIGLAPREPDPYLTLGLLYAGELTLAPQAEKAYARALELARTDDERASAHSGLVFAYYYQGRMAEAAREADAYLVLVPDDAGMKQIRSFARDKMKAK
jgi:tetratricopeptide (TPR) repeat protein